MFLKALFSAVLILFAYAMPAFSAEVLVKEGTRIPITFPNTISSDEFQKGDSSVNAMVNRDVLIDGNVIFKKNDPVELTIEKFKHSAGLGGAGQLVLNGGTVKDITGHQHALNFSYRAKGSGRRAFAVTLYMIGLPLIFVYFIGLIPVAAAIGTRGKAATMQGGAVYDTLVTTPVTITIPDAE